MRRTLYARLRVAKAWAARRLEAEMHCSQWPWVRGTVRSDGFSRIDEAGSSDGSGRCRSKWKDALVEGGAGRCVGGRIAMKGRRCCRKHGRE